MVTIFRGAVLRVAVEPVGLLNNERSACRGLLEERDHVTEAAPPGTLGGLEAVIDAVFRFQELAGHLGQGDHLHLLRRGRAGQAEQQAGQQTQASPMQGFHGASRPRPTGGIPSPAKQGQHIAGSPDGNQFNGDQTIVRGRPALS